MGATSFLRLTYLLPLVASLGLGVWGGRFVADITAHAQVNESAHITGFYDNTAPGVPTNVQEKVCVRNMSPYTWDVPGWQAAISSWLDEPSGWQAVGTTKVDFIASPRDAQGVCINPHIYIDFYDADDPNYCRGYAGCTGFDFGTVTSVDGHNHHYGKIIKLPINVWWNDWLCAPSACTTDDKKRLVNHEMGHVLGEDGTHGGPAWGVAGDGGLYDGYYNYSYSPSPYETYRFRAHYNGRSSPAEDACIGYPASNQILVSWFDTAIDDTTNLVSLWKRLDGSGTWNHIFDMSLAGNGGPFGSRVNFLSTPRSDVTGSTWWTGRADVTGGRRNQVNWDPVVWTQQAKPLVNSTPNRACTLKVSATGNGNISMTWKDGSFNEVAFEIEYNVSTGNGYLDSSWLWRGWCPANTEGCGDTAAPGRFAAWDRLCVRINPANNPYGNGEYSNIACTTVLP